MEKIFDEEVENYLKDTGVSRAERKRLKFNALKSRAVERLKKITTLLEANDYAEIKKFLRNSPSGDDMGCDNDYIEFGDIVGEDGFDIGAVIERLEFFKSK